MMNKKLRKMLDELVAPASQQGMDYSQTIGREMAPELISPILVRQRGKGENERVAPQTGDILRASTRYELLEPIGQGGMGSIFRARQLELSREVAIKTLKPARAEDPGCLGAFHSEALILGMLDHPNIVPMHDLVHLKSGAIAIAMKQISGMSWQELLHPETPEQQRRADQYALEDHLEILIAVCNGVAYAHSKGIIHRDIKPSNVMVGQYGEVLVMDWGMAVTFTETPDRPHSESQLEARSRLTIDRPGGSPGYMAPEMTMAKGRYLGPWTDVYLLGAILYEVLTGDMPHAGDTLHDVVDAAFKSAPPMLPDSVPDELRQICRRAMARRIRDRFPRVEEFQFAVRDYLRHRESYAMVASADGKLEQIATSSQVVQPREDARNTVYESLTDALAGYRQARVLWPGNEVAADGEERARLMFARRALDAGDFGLARTQLGGMERPDARALLAAARQGEADRFRTHRHRHHLKVAIVAATSILVAGLGTALLLVAGDRTRAVGSFRAAKEERDRTQHLLGEAETLRLDAETLAASRLAQLQQWSASSQTSLAELRNEMSRADDDKRKAQLGHLQAVQGLEAAQKEARESRNQLRRSEKAVSSARAELLRLEEEVRQRDRILADAHCFSDALRLKRLLADGPALLRGGESRERVEWLMVAEDIASRLRAHEGRYLELIRSATTKDPEFEERLASLSQNVAALQLAEERLATHAPGGQEHVAAQKEIADVRQCIHDLRKKVEKIDDLQFADPIQRWQFEVIGDVLLDLRRLCEPAGLLPRMRKTTNSASPL